MIGKRLSMIVGAALVAGVAAAVFLPTLNKTIHEITLPLRHEDIIRQQAAAKGLDPAFLAGVIYAESKFQDLTSHAGAKGLMQLTPDTAKYIAQHSGGTKFELSDLSTPQVNISYGAFYLRYLLDRYGGNETLALAAYNGGEGNVDRWVDNAAQQERALRPEDIPFPETRAYVTKVEEAQQQYRDNYAAELGIR